MLTASALNSSEYRRRVFLVMNTSNASSMRLTGVSAPIRPVQLAGSSTASLVSRVQPAHWHHWRFFFSAKEKAADCSAAFSIFVAEGEGFEPSKPFDLHTFQACSFDHSDTPPHCGSWAGGAPPFAQERRVCYRLKCSIASRFLPEGRARRPERAGHRGSPGSEGSRVRAASSPRPRAPPLRR